MNRRLTIFRWLDELCFERLYVFFMTSMAFGRHYQAWHKCSVSQQQEARRECKRSWQSFSYRSTPSPLKSTNPRKDYEYGHRQPAYPPEMSSFAVTVVHRYCGPFKCKTTSVKFESLVVLHMSSYDLIVMKERLTLVSQSQVVLFRVVELMT